MPSYCVCLCVFKEIIYNMDGMHLSMIINRKKKHKNTGNIIKEIIDIIEQNKVTVTTDDSFDSLLNNSLHSNLEGLEAKPLLSNSSYIGLNSINIPPIIKAHFL